MILSDFDLENYIRDKRLVLEPFDKSCVKENGIDLRLEGEIAIMNDLGKDFILDPYSEEDIKKEYTITKFTDRVVIPSRAHVMLTTVESIKMPDNIMGFVELRSTWARHGLSMPPTIIDVGWEGAITLEVVNNAPFGVALKANDRFAHVIFATTLNRVKMEYKGFYRGQRGIRLPKALKKDLP
jgi:dCTP deaminase